jgi:hypothetical protein
MIRRHASVLRIVLFCASTPNDGSVQPAEEYYWVGQRAENLGESKTGSGLNGAKACKCVGNRRQRPWISQSLVPRRNRTKESATCD